MRRLLIRSAAPTPAAVLIPMLLALGCEQQRSDTSAPTEPWLKEDSDRGTQTAPTFSRYRIKADSTLAFSLPTRTHKPKGHLHGIEGYVDLDPRNLARSRGQVTFDLRQLKMEDTDVASADNSTRKENSKSGDAKTTDLKTADAPPSNATSEALRWLGLGETVAQRDQEKNKSAIFEFHSMRSLSHQSPLAGALVKADSSAKEEAYRRQVHATFDGELSLRGFSVKRTVPATLLFDIPDKNTPPRTIEVRLRGNVAVPLSEYEIAPRGPEGHLISEKQSLLGKEVGNLVQVTGSLELEKVSTAR